LQAFARACVDQHFAATRQDVISIACDTHGDLLPAARGADLGAAAEPLRRAYSLDVAELHSCLPQLFAQQQPQVTASRVHPDVLAEHITTQVQALLKGGVQTHSRGLRPPYVAPEGEVEVRIAELWQEVLGIAQIGRDDDFFRLGGSSLLAVQFSARLREVFELEMPLRTLYRDGTLQGMALAVEDLLISQVEALDTAQLDAQPEPAAPEIAASAYELPNGLVVRQFNPVETEHFYADIFHERTMGSRCGMAAWCLMSAPTSACSRCS
jgi:acyl carrier protein